MNPLLQEFGSVLYNNFIEHKYSFWNSSYINDLYFKDYIRLTTFNFEVRLIL